MKVKDAIFLIKNTPILAPEGNKKQIEEAYQIAIKALEKQIPMDVKFDGDDAVCPICGAEAEWKNYCEECGQRLVNDGES